MNRLKCNGAIFQWVSGSLLVMVILVAVGVAQVEISLKVNFQVDGKIGTEMLKRGTWTLSIPDSAQGVLTFKSGRKSVTAPFTRQNNSEPAATDKISYRENNDGSRAIASITPRGKDFTLVIAESPVTKN
ncbi:MAG: hypothetical protein ACOYLN_03115 [Blastocatellia bacterium]|jgi:hypothetical protein